MQRRNYFFDLCKKYRNAFTDIFTAVRNKNLYLNYIKEKYNKV